MGEPRDIRIPPKPSPSGNASPKHADLPVRFGGHGEALARLQHPATSGAFWLQHVASRFHDTTAKRFPRSTNHHSSGERHIHEHRNLSRNASSKRSEQHKSGSRFVIAAMIPA